MIDPFSKNWLQSLKWGSEFKEFPGCDAAFWCIVGSIFGLWLGCLVAHKTGISAMKMSSGCAGCGVKSKGHVISCPCHTVRGSVRLWVWGHSSADDCKEHTLNRWVWFHLLRDTFVLPLQSNRCTLSARLTGEKCACHRHGADTTGCTYHLTSNFLATHFLVYTEENASD